MTAAEVSAIRQQLGEVQGTMKGVTDQLDKMDEKLSEVCEVKTDVAVLKHGARNQQWLNRSVVTVGVPLGLAVVGLVVKFFTEWFQKGD